MPAHKDLATVKLHIPGYLSPTDPGAIGAGKLWIDTGVDGSPSAPVWKQRNAADSGWIAITVGGTPAGAQPLDATLTALAGTLTGANKIPYATATDVAGELTFDTDATLAANSNTRVPSQAAIRAYVGAAVAGLSWKQAVRVATTSAGTLASSFENGDTVDGVVLATGDRILIKDQASGAENGIYIVAASGAPSRATDADSGAELVNATCYVSEGTVNADTQWTCTNNATPTLGSTALTFVQLTSGSGGIPVSTIDAKGDLLVGTANDAVTRLPVGSNGQRIKANSAQSTGLEYVDDYYTVPFVIDGGGAAITTGLKGGVQLDVAGTIVAATVLALDGNTGSIVLDLWKDTYANHPPTIADTITASAKPTISAATKATDSTLTGWTTAVAAGDILFVNVDSVSTFTRVLLSLKIKKS